MSRDRKCEGLVIVSAKRNCEALWLTMVIVYAMIIIISFRWVFEKLIIMIRGVFLLAADILVSFSNITLIIKSVSIDVWSEEIIFREIDVCLEGVVIDEVCDVFSMKDESS